MKTWKAVVYTLGLLSAVGVTWKVARAQQGAEPPMVVVGIYRGAPGKQADLLKWIAQRDAIEKEAGLPLGQLYVHVDGDSWDFVTVTPLRSDADRKKTEELSKKKKLKTGGAAALEFRQYIASHTDTTAMGPTTAADVLKMVAK